MELPARRRGGARRGHGGIALAAAAVVAVSAVFALGLALGGKERREVLHAPPPVSDPLAALDRAEPPPLPTPAPTQATYVFHDALTKERPPDTLAQVGHAPKPAHVPVKPGTAVTTARVAPAAAAQTAPAAAPSTSVKAHASAAAKAPAPLLPAPGAAAKAAPLLPAPGAKVPPPPASTSAPRARGWTIQLVSTPKESEAQRLAAKHPGARVVPAEIDGKRWYRVQLGSFDSRGGAQAELPRVGRPGAFVTMR